MNYKEFKKLQNQRNNLIIKSLLEQQESKVVKFDNYEIIVDPQTFNPSIGEGSLIMSKIKKLFKGKRILDLGTGTGALAMLAAEKSERIVATDISPLAIECATKNFLKYKIDNIETRVGDLFSVVKDDEKFDMIIFNPPFLNGKPKEWIEYSYFDYEYDTLTNFFAKVNKYLNLKGVVYLSFSSVSDVGYLNYLIELNGLQTEIILSELQNQMQFFIYKISQL